MSKAVKKLILVAIVLYAIPFTIWLVEQLPLHQEVNRVTDCVPCEYQAKLPLLNMAIDDYAFWIPLIVATALTFAAFRLHKADSY